MANGLCMVSWWLGTKIAKRGEREGNSAEFPRQTLTDFTMNYTRCWQLAMSYKLQI